MRTKRQRCTPRSSRLKGTGFYCEREPEVQSFTSAAHRVSSSMAAATTPAAPGHTAPAPLPRLDDGPPVIEGFSPSILNKDETFKEKLQRKTKENPFVPIGELHKSLSFILKPGAMQPHSQQHTAEVCMKRSQPELTPEKLAKLLLCVYIYIYIYNLYTSTVCVSVCLYSLYIDFDIPETFILNLCCNT